MVYIREHPCPEPEGFFDIVDEIRLPDGHIIADMDFFTNTQQREFTWDEAMELNEKVFKPEGWHIPTREEWIEICQQYYLIDEDRYSRTLLVDELKLNADEDGYGHYWSASTFSEFGARCLYFNTTIVEPGYYCSKSIESSVRLVKNKELEDQAMEKPRLFRVWSEDQKTYDYKFPYNSAGQFYISESGVLFSDFGNAVAPEVRQEAFVVEWFTGHYDKNGKPIYTGDIVKCILGNKPIVFRDCRYWLGETLDDLFVANLRYDIEVVGNVHQDRKLLEKSTN